MGRAKSLGSLSTTITAPEAPVRKARQPKVVQRGVELAFRRRQNAKFREGKAAVLAVLRRILDEELRGSEATVT